MSSLIAMIHSRSRCGLVLTALLGTMLGVGNWGCRADRTAVVGCTTDMQCPTDSLCMVGTCVRRGTGRTVAVEILPRTDSSAARTGIASLVLGPGQIALAADARAVVDGTVTNAPKAHVILLVPSPIPGQADLQFETDVADFKFQLDVGSRLLHSMATIWLIPNMDAPEQPPVPYQTMLGSSLSFTFPAAAEMTVVRGILHDWWDMPAAPFLARALVDSKVVSNVATTDDAGSYQLLIAPGAVPADAAARIVVDFTPVMPDSGPRFQTVAMPLAAAAAASAQPRVFRMPPSDEPVSKRFLVQSADKGAQPISDVTMRFHAEIPSGTDGVAIYEREARTDAMGEVTVSLVPGTTVDPLNYQITILPPPDSPYGTKCLPNVPVLSSDDDGPSPYAKTFSVNPKVALQGTVRGNDQAPAATVSVMATQLSVTSDCPRSLAASPVSVTTSRTGTFQMLVDPGTYRLEIDPPTGSPVPRLTEEAVVVSDAPITIHDVTLPAGEVVEGDVKGADNVVPLGSASLKIYQVLCHGDACKGPARIPPALQAQTRTDMSGHFRVVLPPLP